MAKNPLKTLSKRILNGEMGKYHLWFLDGEEVMTVYFTTEPKQIDVFGKDIQEVYKTIGNLNNNSRRKWAKDVINKSLEG